MSDSRFTEPEIRTLDDLMLRLLASARARGPGRYPVCPVCGQPMTVVHAGEEASAVLRCDSCGTRLEDAETNGSALQLVA
jgi:tRNA(Ile2) C34 agmatinyltransferase TiaS